VAQHVFGYGSFSRASFAINKDVRAPCTPKDWRDCFTKQAYLLFSVREPFRQIVMPQDFPVFEEFGAVHELFEYAVKYVRISHSLSLYFRGTTVISCGADKVYSTKN
jgi:hypothetical protein